MSKLRWGSVSTLATLTTGLTRLRGVSRIHSSNVTIYTQCVVVDDRGMYRQRRSLRLVALAVTLALPLLGTSSVASAKVKAGCHKTHTCKSGRGTGTGGGTAPITVQVDPNPLVETFESNVAAVVQVETSPSYAGDTVAIEAPQLFDSCAGHNSGFFSLSHPSNVQTFEATLDNEGNAMVRVVGFECAPGTDLFEASLADAPFLTATTEVTIDPPAVTTPGLFAFPTSSGTVSGGEVETGDSGTFASAAYAVFYVETDPVYAGQTVELSSPQLADRCGTASIFEDFFNAGTTGTTSIIDNDGNAFFAFLGASCAAGSSVVTADVLAGTHPTYTTTFNILPPQPTI